ncbi:MAG: 2-hydroxyacyl-CoA dehydratase [Actinobacteria bacterium]|nr:2-hydroxyacyl-CoA dehydratase [Actinomycetota bacterium]
MMKDVNRNNSMQAGWLCAYTPLEIMAAAGLTPVRLFGVEGGSEIADNLMGQNICPYVRSCLAQGLGGEAPDAVVFAGCCDSMRRLYDAWSYYCDSRFTFMIDVPRGKGPASLAIYRNSIRKLADKLENYTGEAITAENLKDAIRQRMKVEAVLDSTSPGAGLNGSRKHQLFIEAQQQDSRTFISGYGDNPFLNKRNPKQRNGKNITISGNLLKSEILIGMVEECGGTVCALDLCSVERFFTWRDISHDMIPGGGLDELLGFLTQSYISRSPCPRTLYRKTRLDNFLGLLRSSGSNGVIYIPLMFCDPFLYELPELKRKTDELGIPGLLLQSNYQNDSIGQIRTRIEAFMEML